MLLSHLLLSRGRLVQQNPRAWCVTQKRLVLMIQRGRSKTGACAWPFVVCNTERRFSFANAVSFLVSKSHLVNVCLQEGYNFDLFKSLVTQTCNYKFLGGYGCVCMYQSEQRVLLSRSFLGFCVCF